MPVLDLNIIEFDITSRSFKQLSLDELAINFQDKSKIYWIHSDLNQQDILKKLAEKLQLPREVIEWCQQEDMLPKLLDSDDALTLQVQCLLATEANNAKASFSRLVIHLTAQFCFTASSEPIPALLEFMKNHHKAIRYAQTPCFILFLIFDNVINDYARALFNIELTVDQMDLRIRTMHKNIYNEVMDIKQDAMKIKRQTIAIREILMRISGRKISVISDQCRTSLYNLSNHGHMLVHESDSIRDILNGLLDQIDNALMQTMNETMKVLTAFAAIFLPLTLITGIYGMNFHWMPELQWKYGYFWALSLIILCAIGLLAFFKTRKWF